MRESAHFYKLRFGKAERSKLLSGIKRFASSVISHRSSVVRVSLVMVNGLSCCCAAAASARSESPVRRSLEFGTKLEAADPNLNPMQAVETESIGDSREESTSACRSAKAAGVSGDRRHGSSRCGGLAGA